MRLGLRRIKRTARRGAAESMIERYCDRTQRSVSHPGGL
jgi:hypothetical protein